MISTNNYIAHVKKSDKSIQSVATHLLEVAEITKKLAAKINVPEAGELIGLLHDFGKYSADFQKYIQSGAGLIDSDSEDFVDAKANKGKIDHSTAGAQWTWQALEKYGNNGKLCGQILALCIASHHSGLIDCLKPDGDNGFDNRIKKQDDRSNLTECQQNSNTCVLEKAQQLADKPLLISMLTQLKLLMRPEQHGQAISDTIKHFYVGFWTRFLFSCLIDADRISSADFENSHQSAYRDKAVSWDIAISRLEFFLTEQQSTTTNDLGINAIRRTISDVCKNRAQDDKGIYTLTVPTGGGKTYASLRYALHHAKKHGLERIFYIIPYTSIIEQNADAIREAIEQNGDTYPWVLEHHSNLEPENQTWHSKLAAENWDAPIVMTTMVQFLETLFSGGTRGVRRLHQLANSVIIFD